MDRREFMVQAMEIMEVWQEDNEVDVTNYEQYDLAARLWDQLLAPEVGEAE